MSEDGIGVEELRLQLATEQPPTVIDVCGADEYAAGHIPESRHIPGDHLSTRRSEIPRDLPVVT